MSAKAGAKRCSAFPSLLALGVSLLANRPHSAAELSRKLAAVALRRAAKGGGGAAAAAADPAAPPPPCPRAAAAAAVAALAARGLVDDAAYARWHVAQRGAARAARPRSRAQLLGELAGKAVARGAADAALAVVGAHSELAACAAAAARKPRLGAAALRRHLFYKAFAAPAVARVLAARAEGTLAALAAGGAGGGAPPPAEGEVLQ